MFIDKETRLFLRPSQEEKYGVQKIVCKMLYYMQNNVHILTNVRYTVFQTGTQ